MSFSVTIQAKSPFKTIDGNVYCIWHYQVALTEPLAQGQPGQPGPSPAPELQGRIGIGFSARVDIKDPQHYPEVGQIQTTQVQKFSENAVVQYVYRDLSAESSGNVAPFPAHAIDFFFLAPGAEDSFTPIILVNQTVENGTWKSLLFQRGSEPPEALVQVTNGPAIVGPGARPSPTTGGDRTSADFKGTLPYASEPFGVYQPLIGWQGGMNQERIADATARRFVRAASMIDHVAALTEEQPLAMLPTLSATDRTGTLVGRQLVSEVLAQRNGGVAGDAWQALLGSTHDSALASVIRNVITTLHQQDRELPASPVRDPNGRQPTRAAALQVPATAQSTSAITHEIATATLLHYLGQKAPAVVSQMFTPAVQPWARVVAAAQWFAENHPAKAAFLSPIGLLHLFREYFFELGTFLGPPVGHVWLSPGGTVELIEVNTRRTLVERTIEQSTETVQKTELSQTDQDELSDAVKVENANDTKLGVTATASGGVAGIFQASGSASFNLDNSRKQAQEQTHKRMRQQSSKLSSEVRQNYKTTFRTVTETTDTSSRRYVMQNTTDRLVSYELSRKMRKVAVQVQDLGQQLCWQLYIDNPGDPLGLGEFVHATSSALDPGVKQPDVQPHPGNQEKTYPLSVSFNLSQGADDDASNTYTTDPDNRDNGRYHVEGFGKNDIIQFKFDFKCPLPPPGYVLSRISQIDFHGAQVKFTIDDADLAPNPNPATNSFSIRLTFAIFGGKKNLPFDVTLAYVPTDEAIQAVDDANKAAKHDYDDQVAVKKEQLFYDTLRSRLKLIGQVKPRPQEDLREEERSMIYRSIISRLYGSETGWTNDEYHVASELIRYLFDVDAMLYFVAPDWWRPRAQTLVSKDAQGELQPTIIADVSISERASYSGRIAPIAQPGHRPYYLITEETAPAPLGASLGWLIQLDGDVHRNAFLNSPWVKAVLPIRPGRESDAIAWLQRPEVAGTDGLAETYPFDPAQDPPEYQGLTIEGVLLLIAEKIAKEYAASLTPVPVDAVAVNPQLALPTETVFTHGFDPLEGGINFGTDAFKVFSQWIEILPTDQVVATEYSLEGLTG